LTKTSNAILSFNFEAIELRFKKFCVYLARKHHRVCHFFKIHPG